MVDSRPAQRVCTIIVSGTPNNFAPYPDVTNNYHRADAIVKYLVDPDLVIRLGWTGDVIYKFQYTWMRNSVNNWQNVDVPNMFFVDNSASRMIAFAGYTPNFNVHMVMNSVAIKW